MLYQQLGLDTEIIVDNFAGGGGASTGIEAALGGRPVHVAINHDPEAIALHKANHPLTEHYCESVFDVDPVKVCRGRPVGLAWFSPDCKHHSKARGGKPVNKNIRGLAWIVLKWVGKVRPRIIMLENVEEFQYWGPLVAKNKPGKQIPISEQEMQPCKKRKGKTFKRFVNILRSKGYSVGWTELRAHDYGAPTIRKRLVLIARCDGVSVQWPTPSHGKGKGLKPYRTAAEIIDWSIPCPSIFERKKPLAPNTMARIARGLKKYVFDAKKPFIVTVNHGGNRFRGQDIDKPLTTLTAKGSNALVVPHLDRICQTGAGSNTSHPITGQVKTICSKNEQILVSSHLSRQFGKSTGSDVQEAVPTVTAGGSGKTALVQAFMAQHNTGVTGHEATKPLSTITGRGTQQQIVTSHMINMKGSGPVGHRSSGDPVSSICAAGNHVAEVRAFLTKWFGKGDNNRNLNDPISTVTAKDRFGLVTVHGEPYQITDIGMRMLSPRELYRAQGFPDSYKIQIEYNGKTLTKTAQVRMCGNSVCPPLAEALVRANMAESVLFNREAAE